jgi:hypothetical protein
MSYKSNFKIFSQVTYTEEKNEEDARIHNYLNKIRNNIHTNLSEIQSLIFQLKSSANSNKVNMDEHSVSICSFSKDMVNLVKFDDKKCFINSIKIDENNSFQKSVIKLTEIKSSMKVKRGSSVKISSSFRFSIKTSKKKKCFQIVRNSPRISNFTTSLKNSKEIHSEKECKSVRTTRGKYQMFNEDLKKEVVLLVKNGFSIRELAKKYSIPPKSIKRWIVYGPSRQKGGGRKIKDPKMEEDLLKWIKEANEKDEVIKGSDIQEQARLLTNYPDFKASKGWLEKFRRKHNIPKS